jgi:hypothetical protein
MTIKNKRLQQKILKMAERDQRLRKQAIKDSQNKKLIKKVYDCDSKNISEAKRIIEKYGWPTFDLVGKKASNAFWLLIQHADRDIKFQKKCLKLLKEAANNNQAHLQNVAYLTDRILVAEKKKQRFGTQFMLKGKKLVSYPIIAEKNLNEIRKEYGLNAIEKQIEKINREYSRK